MEIYPNPRNSVKNICRELQPRSVAPADSDRTKACSRLACRLRWKESENKFKCPCHGSGYDSDGVNFEGPAPRPMDRARVELDAQGQIVVDVGKLYKCPKGERCEFDDAGAYLQA